MSTPQQRRRDPVSYGRGWETAAAALTAVVAVVGLAALAGLGMASWVFGDGWVWPHSSHAITAAVGGILRGRPAQGLSAEQLRRVPGPAAVYTCVVTAELICISALIALALAVARRLRHDGMATRAEAQQALGIGQLREARPIIRPDLDDRKRDRA